MLRSLFSLYRLGYPRALVYMLQSTEYQVGPYLRWYWQTTDFSRVAYRRSLKRTRPARLLLLALRSGMGLQVIAGLFFVGLWYQRDFSGGWQFGVALVLAYPIVWAHVVVLPLLAGKWLIVQPRQRRLITRAEQIFRKHRGIKLAIAGSYGKTSLKELLLTVLKEGKKVAATPANKNVAISHAYFARTLKGDEDIVIIEYGEGGPGDVSRFARVTHPTHAVVTGIAPAHLDRYKTVERAAQDIFSVAHFVESAHMYVNAESPLALPFLKKQPAWQRYDQSGTLGWRVQDVRVSLEEGTAFTLAKGSKRLELRSGLLGRHHIGPLALTAALAAMFGLTNKQIQTGISKTAPFEHRMQPYRLGDAWIIDDTYNGNLEGVRAGTALLKELPAKRRKIYVTPGLVDQGEASERVHEEVGKLIAKAKPDVVVLMKNSVTPFITSGLTHAGYDKQVVIEDDPLNFYTNLSVFVAAGDVVLMQNDWTDNYS